MKAGIGLRTMTGCAIASAAALVITIVWVADHGPEPSSPSGDMVRVGVVEGQSVLGYLRGSGDELAALQKSPPGTETWALVSLGGYVAPDRIAAPLAGTTVAQVLARSPHRTESAPRNDEGLGDGRDEMVRIPAYQLPGDVVAGFLSVAERRDRERAEYLQMAEEQTGPGAERIRAAYREWAAVAATEAKAYRAHCACVFAAVVRGTPAALHKVAGQEGVRAVDPAPEVADLDRAEFAPPLPEQRDEEPEDARSATAGAPDRDVPVAPATPPPLPSSSGAPVISASSDDPAAGSGPSASPSEEPPAVPSVPPHPPAPDVSSAGPGASPDRSGR